MKNCRYILFTLMLALSLVLSGCMEVQPIDPSAQTAVAQTLDAIIKQSATSENTSTLQPTHTQTETPIPTSTITPTSTNTLIPTVVIDPSGPTNFPSNVNPLTGMIVDDPSLLDRRPVLVKVANHPVIGRPHAGLSTADIVFEYYIGASVNRFMSLHYGQDDDRIGPIRSGRLVDSQIVSMYQGILGFWSADSKVLTVINNILGRRAINGIYDYCPAMCDDGRNYVYTKFANSEALSTLSETLGVDNTRKNLDGMRFDPKSPSGGELADDVLISYSPTNLGEWRYDQVTGKYLRWIEEEDAWGNITMIPLVDANTNEQLKFSNVIVLYAYYTEYSPTLHDISVWDNYSGKTAIIFRNGQAHEVTWKAVNQGAPIQFFDSSGNVFPLNPGNTWMAFIGTYSQQTSSDGNWTFTNYLP